MDTPSLARRLALHERFSLTPLTTTPRTSPGWKACGSCCRISRSEDRARAWDVIDMSVCVTVAVHDGCSEGTRGEEAVSSPTRARLMINTQVSSYSSNTLDMVSSNLVWRSTSVSNTPAGHARKVKISANHSCSQADLLARHVVSSSVNPDSNAKSGKAC